MSSIIESYQKRRSLPLTDSLPVFKPDSFSDQNGLRRRLSSLSLPFRFQSLSSSSSSWGLWRSKSVSANGENTGNQLRKWWEWGWSWILSKKPIFAIDLEMNKEEAALIGSHNRGSWRYVCYKLRYEIRRLMRSDKVGLPQTYRYDSADYAKNFDDGTRFDY